MGTHSCKFDEKMKSLKEQFIESTDATGIKHSNNNMWFADNTIYYYCYCSFTFHSEIYDSHTIVYTPYLRRWSGIARKRWSLFAGARYAADKKQTTSSYSLTRSRALKSGLIRFFFFIQNSVFLSQISSDSSRFLQISLKFLQTNGPKRNHGPIWSHVYALCNNLFTSPPRVIYCRCTRIWSSESCCRKPNKA